MITSKILKDYSFDKIEEYFDYVVLSIVNGQKTQAKSLFGRLSSPQQKEFNNWIEYDLEDGDLRNECHQMLKNSTKLSKEYKKHFIK